MGDTDSSRHDAPASSAGPSAAPRSILANVRLVSLCTLLSRVLGLVREMAMAWLFGAGAVSDAFTLAFRIPNLFRQLLGEGALTTAFLPRFVQDLQQSGPESARRLSSGVLVILGGLLLAIVATAEAGIGAALLLGEWSDRTRLMLQLLAILVPYLFVICLSAQLCAVLQSLRQFLWPALIPVLLNLAWIVSACIAPWTSTDSNVRVQLVAAGVVAGGIVQLAVPYFVLGRAGFSFTSQWKEATPRVREVFRAMVPVIAGVVLSQLNTLTDTILAWWLSGPGSAAGTAEAASRLDAGTASALYYAHRLLQFPLGVFGVALGTVLFPVLTSHAKRGDGEGFRRELGHGLEMALAIGIPASLALVYLAEPLSRVLFQRGNFDARDAALTARMIAGYGAGVWALIALLILNRGFYALEDRMTPIRVGSLCVAVNLGLSLAMVFSIGGHGLAWATSLTAISQLGITILVLHRKVGGIPWGSVVGVLGRTLPAAVLMLLACEAVRRVLARGNVPPALALFLTCAGGGAAYLVAATLTGLKHPWELLRPSRRSERLPVSEI